MRLRLLVLLALLLATPAMASATMLSQFDGATIFTFPSQTFTVNLWLTDVTSTYTDSNLRISINGGVEPAPTVTAIFGVSATSIPSGNLTSSIWAQGGVGPAGVEPVAAFNTNAFIPQQAAGLYAVLTINTGTVPGVYDFDLSGSDLINGLTPDFEPIFVDLNAVGFTVFVTPEPSTYALAAFGAIGLLAVKRRKAVA